MFANYFSIKNQENYFDAQAAVYSSKILQNRFIDILYHDIRGGQAIRLLKHTNGDVKQHSTCDLNQLAPTGTDLSANCYTSLNTFRGNKRSVSEIYNLTGMYIDLDCHTYRNEHELIQSKKIMAARLIELWKQGVLPRPTMVTDSGRGYGIYYILEKSIPNVEACQKSIRYFRLIYEHLMKKYQECVNDYPMEADMKVMDASRVCRLPGTINQNNGHICMLILEGLTESGNPLYYDLGTLANQLEVPNVVENKKLDIKEKNKVIRFPVEKKFFVSRMLKLQKLQEMRGDRCTGAREQMCFIAYSALVQIHSKHDAVEKLYAFNAKFSDPLPSAELEHIVTGTDRNEAPDGAWTGYYRLKDAYLIRSLELTPDEVKMLGFGMSSIRYINKVENKKNKEERDKEIVVEIQDGDLSYQEIAEKHDVSERTVIRIGQKYGVSRYSKKSVPECGETDKNFHESVVGDLSGVLSSVDDGHAVSPSASGLRTDSVWTANPGFIRYLCGLETRFGSSDTSSWTYVISTDMDVGFQYSTKELSAG